jgi:RNA polymerase sigma-70 factor (ECF subfamily)
MGNTECTACRGCPTQGGAGGRCRALVRVAAGDDPSAARDALAAFCDASWRPVNAFVRGQGYGAAEAEDLTQSYFARFLEKRYVEDARSWTGCFRPFLRVSVRHFLSNERDRERAAKRGGGRPLVSLDAPEERGAPPAPVDPVTPEVLLERRRLEAAVERACARLREEGRRPDRRSRVDRLMEHLDGRPEARSYRATAREWGVSESAVRVAVHRLRKRLAGLLELEGVGS